MKGLYVVMVYWKTVSAQVLIPGDGTCACCQGKSNDLFRLKLKRMRFNNATIPAFVFLGFGTTTTEVLEWDLPGCRACCQHVRSLAVVRVLSLAVAMAVTVAGCKHLYGQLETGSEGFPFELAGLIIPVPTYMVAWLVFKKFLVITTQTCAGYSMPVTVKPTFIGDGLHFRFRNDAWAKKFIDLNSPPEEA